MNKRIILTLMSVLLVGSLVAACGGAPAPVAFSSMPVFTDATESTNAALNDILTTQIEKGRASGQVKSIDGKMYDVPADTTWEAVTSFYKTELEKTGWTAGQPLTPQLGQEVLPFSRGKQAFVVSYLTDFPALFVVMTEEK